MNPLDLVRLTALMERAQGRPEIIIGLIDGPVILDHPDLTGERIGEVSGKLGSACARSDSAAIRLGRIGGVDPILAGARNSVDPIPGRSAAEIIRLLDLQPHPEGGHFRETFRDRVQDLGGRAVSTLIYFLLERGEVSRWHRVDVAEVWHFYAGAPLEISISQNGSETSVHRLGPDVVTGERPQYVVQAHCWQSAKSLGAWTLVGCSVAPGFEFSGFELAPPGWQPASAGTVPGWK